MYYTQENPVMTQLNIRLTAEFNRNLRKFMKVRHIKSKAEAIRAAIKEGLNWVTAHEKSLDFSKWLGLAKEASINNKSRFNSDDDLWK
jgi:hypothetical protein